MHWYATIFLAQAGGELFSTLLMFGVIFFIFWIFLIRPQQKEFSRHQALVDSLKAGDEVVTSGGIFGKISSIDGPIVHLELGKGTKIRVDRQKVQKMQSEFEMEQRQKERSAGSKKEDKKEDKKQSES